MGKLSLTAKRKIAYSIAIEYCYGKVLFGINQRAKREGVSNKMVSDAVDYVKKSKPYGEVMNKPMATKKKAVKKTVARFVKGSKAAKDFMAKLRAQKSIGGWTKGQTRMIEVSEAPKRNKKNVRVKRKKDGVFKEFKVLPKVSLLGIGNITMDKLHKVNKDIINMELALDKNIKTSKLFPYKTPFWKKELAKNKKIIKNFIIELKKHKTELKKLL